MYCVLYNVYWSNFECRRGLEGTNLLGDEQGNVNDGQEIIDLVGSVPTPLSQLKFKSSRDLGKVR